MKKELTNKDEYVADGIASCYHFNIANAKDLEKAQALLKQKYFKREDVQEVLEELDKYFEIEQKNTKLDGDKEFVDGWQNAIALARIQIREKFKVFEFE